MPRTRFYHATVTVALLAAALALLAGCQQGGQKGAARPSDLPQTLKVEYKGRTADYWGARLLESDEGFSQQGAIALAEIGDEGLRFFWVGLNSKKPHVRKQSVTLTPWHLARPYASLFLPRLEQLLGDSEDADIPGRARAAINALKE